MISMGMWLSGLEWRMMIVEGLEKVVGKSLGPGSKNEIALSNFFSRQALFLLFPAASCHSHV